MALAGEKQPLPFFSPRSYICYKTENPLVIDGRSDEHAWQKAPWTEDFKDIEGDKRPAPRLRTRAKMLWDERYLYIFAELEETDIWATLTERDTIIYLDNDFEVFIDPDGDTHKYYEFEMNALNTIWELFLVKPYRDGGPYMSAWDIKGLKSAVLLDGTLNQPSDRDRSWKVEIAFPWDVLKECANKPSPPRQGDQWRINFSRVEYKLEVKNGEYQKAINPETSKPYPEDNWVWSPQGLVNMHYPEMWGFVQFSERFAGTGEDKFVMHPEEYAKWALRQVYYKESDYFKANGRYSNDLGVLGVGNYEVKGYVWPPKIETTTSMYEAILRSQDGGQLWHICQDGRTWMEAE